MTSRRRRSVRRNSRKLRRNSRRRTSRKLVKLFANKTVRKTSKPKPRKRVSKARRRVSKGRWLIVVKGKTLTKKFRSSSSLRAYAAAKYGKRGFKYVWKAA